jgi:hypothetical protein
VRQGRDIAVNKALLRVRRLLSSELQTVMSVAEGAVEGQDDGFSGLQAVQLLQHQQLLPGRLQSGALASMIAVSRVVPLCTLFALSERNKTTSS